MWSTSAFVGGRSKELIDVPDDSFDFLCLKRLRPYFLQSLKCKGMARRLGVLISLTGPTLD